MVILAYNSGNKPSFQNPTKNLFAQRFIHEMKQLDIVVNPPAFLWDPYLTLPHVIFDLDICDLSQTVPEI